MLSIFDDKKQQISTSNDVGKLPSEI